MEKKINEISSNQNQTKLYQHCIQLLEQCLTKVRHNYAKGGIVGSLMENGKVGMPSNILKMRPMPVMQQMRISLAEGGFIDDEAQIRYLISVLEGGHLNLLEQKLLLELYEDLRKIQGGSK
jgi:hypothetical protein